MREGDVKEAEINILPVIISTGYGCQLEVEVELVSAPGQPVLNTFKIFHLSLHYSISGSLCLVGLFIIHSLMYTDYKNVCKSILHICKALCCRRSTH